MSTISVRIDRVKEALKTYTKDHKLDLNNGKIVSIPFTEDNRDLLEFLQESALLSNQQKSRIAGWLFHSDDLGAEVVGSVKDFLKKTLHISSSTEPTLELKIANRWYPVMATVEKFTTFTGSQIVEITAHANVGGLQYTKYAFVGDWAFKDPMEVPLKKSVNELLKEFSLRVATPEGIADAKKALARLTELNTNENKVFDAHGTGLVFHQYWGFSDVLVGWKESPVAVIIEPTLENPYAHREMQDTTWHLPFVRVFSLKHKNYLFVDVRDLDTHVYHRDGKNKIVLPESMMTALESIFNAHQDQIFGDLFHGRHGGIVVMANGPSGVGKTLTAEVFAEYQERPLYSMEMSEIGTTVKEVEANLTKIFARAKKWNAVLLFDEADIFLSERVASDLERSAIVGIFLRLLDYYEGTFFLTTNRGSEIDKAFKSRVTLYLNYPDLSDETRLKVWQNMLGAAKLEVVEDSVSWKDVAAHKLNGRQIRNQVRLVKLMYPNTQKLTTSQLKSTMQFAAP